MTPDSSSSYSCAYCCIIADITFHVFYTWNSVSSVHHLIVCYDIWSVSDFTITWVSGRGSTFRCDCKAVPWDCKGNLAQFCCHELTHGWWVTANLLSCRNWRACSGQFTRWKWIWNLTMITRVSESHFPWRPCLIPECCGCNHVS